MARPRQILASDQPDPELWLRGLPKAELHLHLEGSITAETLVELSLRNDPTPLTHADARAIYTYHDFPSFLLCFKAVNPNPSEVMSTPKLAASFNPDKPPSTNPNK